MKEVGGEGVEQAHQRNMKESTSFIVFGAAPAFLTHPGINRQRQVSFIRSGRNQQGRRSSRDGRSRRVIPTFTNLQGCFCKSGTA